MTFPTEDTTTTTISEEVLDGPHGPLRVRIYAPAAPVGPGIVWAHGGGFAAGDLDMLEGDGVSRHFADRGITVISVAYRLAPEHLFPTAHDELVFAFDWARSAALAVGPWAIGGASAGPNLVTGAALRLDAAPALVVLAYPTLHAVQDAPDAALRALLDADPSADRFGPAAVRRMYENYLGTALPEPDVTDVRAVPGLASREQLKTFPATIIINSEADELRVSGEAFAGMLQQAGVDVDCSLEPGTQHGHLNRPEPAASRSLARFTDRILALIEPR